MEASIINNFCRTCTKKDNNMTLLNSALLVNGNEIHIFEILSIFDIKVQSMFPDSICSECLERAINAHEFKIQCQNSTLLLQSVLDDKNNCLLESDQKNEILCCNYTATQKTPTCSNQKDDIKEVSGETSEILNPTDLKWGEITLDIDKPNNNNETGTNADSGFSILKENSKGSRKRKSNDALMFCAECNKSFKNKYILTAHVKRHQNKGQFLCKVCGKGFNAQSCLSRHARVHTGEKKYECEVCHKRFPSANNLNLHSRRHSGIKPYLCTLCGMSFSHPTGLTYHTRTHTREKPYSCDVCGKKFRIQCHRDRHSKIHSGERPFACNMCDKAFIKKFDLQRHQDVHLGNKPYVCKLCSKAFVRKMQLSYHMMVHTEERPHVCNYCGKGFIRRYYLSSHIKKQHQSDVSVKAESF